ncbi:MAG: glycine--tRNA ligase subunit beta, partial [Rhodospirillales bacterium]|nr:glycine--tRNA ligase subunit beta [Rhodospirillales bacterium]
LGVIRIILENDLRLNLLPQLRGDKELFGFIIERLRVKLRGEGRRFDVLDAVLAAGEDDDLVRLMKRVAALEAMLGTEDGKNLLAAYKRADSIVTREGEAGLDVDIALMNLVEEKQLNLAIRGAWERLGLSKGMALLGDSAEDLLTQERYPEAMVVLASLRPVIDAFFENVTVNADAPELRRNRLRLLNSFTWAVDQVADFSRIEG